MEINSTGIVKTDLTEYLGFWTTKLREVFGNNFVIRKEGVVDNIATTGSLTCMALEDVIAYLTKQMNPYTAEGEFQDALYALVGLTRNYASFTKVTRTIEGTANLTCPAGSIRFKNSATDDIFQLNTDITIGSDGKAVGSFTAIELGAIDLDSEALLDIIDAPEGIVGVYYASGNVTSVGDDYEDDSQFRLRWIATNSIKPNTNTEGGLRNALLPLCGNNSSNIVLRQNRSTLVYDDFGLHSMNIVLKSAESNETIAKTIFNNLVDGNMFGLVGTTTVVVKDDENQDVTIKFTRATEVPTYFSVEIVLKEGFYLVQVIELIQEAIVNNFDYQLGEKIIANDFYQYINNINGIDYVENLQISLDDITYSQVATLDYNEYGTIVADHITVSEAE